MYAIEIIIQRLRLDEPDSVSYFFISFKHFRMVNFCADLNNILCSERAIFDSIHLFQSSVVSL